ncbi:MAG: NADH-quinone oxidoreductase subunit C, partial [Mariprofundaceae bacterium]|nr:NADH-quinone oxidoreductase subunit C [Mariprofundaceae bacterium]
MVMSKELSQEKLPEITALEARFADVMQFDHAAQDCPTCVVSREAIVDVCHALKSEFAYEQLIDLCGLDMSEHPSYVEGEPRFVTVYHLLSVSENKRLRLKVLVREREMVESVTEVWSTANWFEREAFDMYGIIFRNHPDLRRLLTDYGFEGHPLRKDFPLTGHAEMFFDDEQWRCVYKPNTLENKVLIPKSWPGVDRG